MLFKTIVIILCLGIFFKVNCQESFELHIADPGFQTSGDLHVDDQGNYIVVGGSMDIDNSYQSGIALKISPLGEVIVYNTYNFPDTSCNFFSLIQLDSNYLVLGGIGPSIVGLSSILVCSFDFNLNLLWRKNYKISEDHVLGGFKAKVDLDSNIIMMGSVLKEVKYLDTDPFEFRCSPSGDSLLMIVENLNYNQRVFDFLILPDSSGYVSFGSGQYPFYPYIDANAAYYNNIFSREKVREIPNDIYWSHTAKWINETEFFISGNKHLSSPSNIHPVGFMRLDTSFAIIDDVHFGVIPDTSCYPAWIRSFDYLDIDNVFFAWTKNFDNHFQNVPSWIMLSKFDSSLNIVYERYYGGDVMYAANQISATDDGGCIIAGIRYDYNNMDYNYDLYLIKTDENGLVTKVNEDYTVGESNISVYPNPCLDKISFDNDLSLIEIFDQTGHMILSYNNYSQSRSINVGNLKSGIYLYRVIDKNGLSSAGKLIKL
jgi:hypothetical protein